MFYPDGKRKGLVVVGRDITDKVHVSRDLEKTQALLSAALEQSPAGIMVAEGSETKVVIVNKAAEIILGEPDFRQKEISEKDLTKLT